MKTPAPTEVKASALDKRDYPTPPEQLVLIELPRIVPRWPNPGTIASRLLSRFLKGERLTQADFKESWRLAAYIYELKALGWQVLDMPVGYGDTEISLYWLARDDIAAVMKGAA